MKALAVMSQNRDRAVLGRAVEFLLAHRLFFSHTTGKPVRRFWPAPIQFPAHYAHDLLHPLRALTLAGAPDDERLTDALDLLVARADTKLRWRIDETPTMRVEPLGRPSKWATAWALAVLEHFGRLAPVAADNDRS
jgi:hypothetical protein